MDHLQRLRAFRLVLDRGSFSQAARELDLAPGTVSKLVSELEAHLGARLLQRSTRSLSATEAGRVFHQRAAAILDALEDAEAAVHDLQAAPRGQLRVSLPTSFGLRWVAPRIPRFLAAHPEVTLELALNDRFVDLLDEGFDLALRVTDQLPDSNLVVRKLGSVPRELVASPAYLARHGTPGHPSDLARHITLSYTLARLPGVWQLERRDGGERHTVTLDSRLKVNNGVMLRETLLAGLGLTLTPAFVVDDLLASGALVRVLPDWQAARVHLHALLPHARVIPPKTRAFVDFMAAEAVALG